MPWHLVVIKKQDGRIAGMEGNALIEIFHKESGAACADAAVEVWHRRDAEATHQFYFSPAAVSSAPETLKRFRSSECVQRPDLIEFKKIQL